MLRPIFGDKALMGGVGYVGTTIGRPGVIPQTGPLQRLVFGEYDGRRSARAETFLAACKKGGINAELSARRPALALGEIRGAGRRCRARPRPCATPSVRSAPIRMTREFLLDLAREVVAVGRAHGVNLPADYAEQRIRSSDGWPPEMTASMHHDLKRGKPLELRWLSGGVVDLGAKVGVPTPMNRAVRDILTLHAEGKSASAH